ncbi:MAG: FtsH protease activity modulator HflK, partial [Alphaproteobacteria bacterium]
ANSKNNSEKNSANKSSNQDPNPDPDNKEDKNKNLSDKKNPPDYDSSNNSSNNSQNNHKSYEKNNHQAHHNKAFDHNKNAYNSKNNNQFEGDLLDKIVDKIINFINSFKDNKNKLPNSDKSILGLIALSFLLLYLSLGFYKVNTDENAVVLYFGKFHKISTPGLNYYIPFPFGQVIKKSVTSVNTEEFGFASDSRKSSKRNFDAESLMLTGDENIVDIEFQVQWQIADIRDYVFNIVEPNQAIRKSAESAMREIIARSPIADALSDGKQQIEQDAKNLLQEILDAYGAGVRIILVQLRRVDPPSQVIDAFRDVQTAKADKEREINQAQAYANDIIPRARGLAAQMLEQSQAYSKEIVANSEGEAGRFSSIYNQYSKAKQVTKKRLYLETMEQIYRNMDKIYVDRSVAKSAILPYFSVNNPINNAISNISDSTNSPRVVENTSKPITTTNKP